VSAGLRASAALLALASALAASGCASNAGDCGPAAPTIAYDSFHADNVDVMDIDVMGGDGANRRLLVEDAHSPEWSPDGCSIAFVRDGLYVVDPGGGPPKKLTPNPPGESSPGVVAAAWSPDGDRIALTFSGEEGPTAAPERPSTSTSSTRTGATVAGSYRFRPPSRRGRPTASASPSPAILRSTRRTSTSSTPTGATCGG
jgi:WD40-like Beta Propeller Repeat